MINKKQLYNYVVRRFKSFCKHSTLHGVYYFSKSTNWFLHIIWSTIIICSIALCCFLSHMIWEKFIIDPTLTVVETTHYSMVNLAFPAVTVCDTEQVYPPQTDNITHILKLRGYKQNEIEEYYKSFTLVRTRGYQPQPFVKKMHLQLEDIGYSMKDLLDMFKRPCSAMLTQCGWRSRYYNCSDMFRSVKTVLGHCCQFDIPYFSHKTDHKVNIVSGLDSSEALDLVVQGQLTVDGRKPDTFSMLYVYDIKDKLTHIDSYINLVPETYFDVNVYVWAIDSSPNVKSLALSSRKCILESDQGVGASFYQGCMSRLVLQKVVNRCRCLPFDYKAEELQVEDFSICSWERLICIYQTIELVQADIKDIIAASNCYQRCDYVQYDTEVEFVKNQRLLSKMSQNQSRLQVHFGQTTCMKYRREVLYTWDQMLANLGGIFGLCLGGSIISIMEIIWFLLELLFTSIKNILKKPAKKHHSKSLFIISRTELEINSVNTKDSNLKFVH